MMLENTIDDLHHLEKMILQSQLVTQRLMSQKKAVQALHSLIQRIATGEGPRIDWSSIKYAFSCRYSYSSSSLDLRQVPVESYTLMVRYMTSTSLKELGAAQHLFRKAVVWLRGHPMHRDWQKIENCVRKEHSEWAILFRRDVFEYLSGLHNCETNRNCNLHVLNYKATPQIPLVEVRLKLEKLKAELPDADQFLRFLCILYAPDIPQILLELACIPQKYWRPDGEIATRTLTEGGLLFCSVLGDSDRTMQAIDQLRRRGLISTKSTTFKCSFLQHPHLSIDPVLHLYIKYSTHEKDLLYFKLDAIRLLCYIYPKYKDIEPLYEELARLLITQLVHVLAYRPNLEAQGYITPQIASQIAETSISALPFFQDKVEMLGTTKEIIQAYNLDYLQSSLALQEEKMLRQNVISQDESNLPFIAYPGCEFESREVALSKAYNLFSENRYDNALMELARIPYTTHSTRERLLRERADLASGIAYRNIGNFVQGLSLLERLYEASDGLPAHTPTGNSLICHLSALYVELHRPLEAVVLLEDQRSALEDWGWDNSGKGRQNLVYLAAAYLHLNPWRAESNVQLLEATLKRREGSLRSLTPANNTKIFTRVNHPWAAVMEICLWLEARRKIPHSLASKMIYLQLLTICARVSLLQTNFKDALLYCEEALKVAGTCWPSEGSFEMVIYKTMGLINFYLGNVEDFKQFTEKAERLSINYPPRFWNVGLGTFWEEFLRKSSNGAELTIGETWQECLTSSNQQK